MFKSYLLSSARYFAPENEGGSDTKTDIQKQRDSIKVEVSGKPEPEKKNDETSGEENDDGSEEGDEGKEEDDETDGEEEGKEGEEERKELTAEQKEIKKLQKTVERLQRRVGKTVGERENTKKELADAKKALEAKVADGETGLTEEEVERRAEAKANQKAIDREFARNCKALSQAAISIDKDFQVKIDALAEDVAPIPGAMVHILSELDNGGAVLAHLANNDDEYEEIHTLSPARMSIKLAKLSEKLLTEAKPKPKKISKVPEPNKPLGGGSKSPDVLPTKPTENMSEFARVRAIQVEQRRKQKLGIAG